MDRSPPFEHRMAALPVLVAAVAAVGASAILVEEAKAPSLTIAFWRLVLAVIVMAPASALERASLKALRVSDAGTFLLAGALLALHFVAWFLSLRATTVMLSTLLVSTYPLFLYFLERVLQEPTVAERSVLPIVVALVGIALLCVGSGSTSPGSLLGDLLALVGALSMAGYLLVGRRLRQRLPTFSYATAVYLAASLLLFATILLTHTRLLGFSWRTDVMLILLALGPTLVGHTGFNYALRFFPATLIGIAQIGEPVVATLLAYLLLGQVPSGWALFGAVLVVGGIALFLGYRRGGGRAILGPGRSAQDS